MYSIIQYDTVQLPFAKILASFLWPQYLPFEYHKLAIAQQTRQSLLFDATAKNEAHTSTALQQDANFQQETEQENAATPDLGEVRDEKARSTVGARRMAERDDGKQIRQESLQASTQLRGERDMHPGEKHFFYRKEQMISIARKVTITVAKLCSCGVSRLENSRATPEFLHRAGTLATLGALAAAKTSAAAR